MSVDSGNREDSISTCSSYESSSSIESIDTTVASEKQEEIMNYLPPTDYLITSEPAITDDNNNEVGKSMEIESIDAKPLTFILHPNHIHNDSIQDIESNLTDRRVGKEKEFGDFAAYVDEIPPHSSQDVLASTPKTLASGDEKCKSRLQVDAQLQVSIASSSQNDGGSSDDEVPDVKNENTKTLDCRPCSNTNCVREAEWQKRKRQSLKLSKDSVEPSDDSLFVEGSLPSYHSLLQIWNDRNFKWSSSIFKSGNPVSDKEFLSLWRACRKNPKAYGIKITPFKELPDLERPKLKFKSKLVKPKISELKQNNSELNQLKREECESMRKRIEELRCLYPHLPPITGFEAKTKSKLQIRLKQAENWHRLMTNEPKRDTRSIHDLDRKYPCMRELDFNKPRYASSTKSFRSKIRSIVPHI